VVAEVVASVVGAVVSVVFVEVSVNPVVSVLSEELSEAAVSQLLKRTPRINAGAISNLNKLERILRAIIISCYPDCNYIP
jgi:hypothetical protein